MPNWGGGGADKGDASTNTANETMVATEVADTTVEDASAAEADAEPTSPASE